MIKPILISRKPLNDDEKESVQKDVTNPNLNNQNINDRIMILNGDIEDNNISTIISNISKISLTDTINDMTYKNYTRYPIYLFIQSFGGSIYDAFSLIDIILTSDTPVYTFCSGYAMSAAFLIFISGHYRYVTRHARLLYHQISSFEYGKVKDIIENVDELKYLQDMMETYVTEHTKLTKEELQKAYKHKKDIYYNADECIKKGIADEIVTEAFVRNPIAIISNDDSNKEEDKNEKIRRFL